MLEAVAPATSRLVPFAVTVWSRTVSTRSSVAVVSGPLVGVTPITAIDLSGEKAVLPTLATSSSLPSPAATDAAAAGPPFDGSSATTVSWPLAPAPKPLVIRS